MMIAAMIVAVCYDPETRGEVYREKPKRARSFKGLPVIAEVRLFEASDLGVVLTLKCGREFEVIAENKMEKLCMVTPALADGIIFFRTQQRLVAIGK